MDLLSHTIRFLFLFLLLRTSISAPTSTGRFDYTGYKVLRIHPHSEPQLRFLQEMEDDPRLGLEFWGETIANVSIDIQVPPSTYRTVTDKLTAAGLSYSVNIPDVQSLIDEEEKENDIKHRRLLGRRKRATSTRGRQYFYNYNIVGMFARHHEINRWIESASLLLPGVVETFDIGRSYEGRSMKVIKIGGGNGTKPAIWIDAGIHGREWISPATAIYLIYTLVANYNKRPSITFLVDTFDWYFLPVANPDGYEYTFTRDRMWRKSRSRTPWPHCIGVDLNRNFGYHWMDCSSAALYMRRSCASRYPCASTYAGRGAFSEPETVAMSRFITSIKDDLKLYLSLHSYSQMWLTTWGFSATKDQDHLDIMDIARRGAGAILRRHGRRFRVGSPPDILYPAAGGSYDWAKGVASIKYSYALELRDRGHYGFLLPVSEILPSGEEILAAVTEITRRILQEEAGLRKNTAN